MPGCSATCPDFGTNGTIQGPTVTPDPDISGTGVLIGFIASAYFTLILIIVYYAMGCVPQEYLNEVDNGFLRMLWKRTRFRPSKTWDLPLRNAVLMFSDQQIVTGIALLAGGYSQLCHGISSYHWQIVVYLTWFSSITHLTTLTALRHYFREQPAVRIWRALFMLITVIMLGIALLPTGDQNWPLSADSSSNSDDSLGVPAVCFFQKIGPRIRGSRFTVSSTQTTSMIISILILFFSYLMRLIKLSKSATNFCKEWFRAKPGRALKNMRDVNERRSEVNKASLCKYVILEIIYIFLLAYFDIWESMLWEILWLIFALAWGTGHLLFARIIYEGDDTSVSNYWGFGQWFPVILLILPVLSIGENCYEARTKSTAAQRTKKAPTGSIRSARSSPQAASEASDNLNFTNVAQASPEGMTAGAQASSSTSTITGQNHLPDTAEPMQATNTTQGEEPGLGQNTIIGTVVLERTWYQIGYFPPKPVPSQDISLGIAPRQIALSARTGTDLQREEQNIETPVCRRVASSTQASSLPDNNEASDDGQATNNARNVSRSRVYYCLEWFWALIVFDFLMISVIVGFAIYMSSSFKVSVLNIWGNILNGGFCALTSTFVYIGSSVLLTRYRTRIGKLLDRSKLFKRPFRRVRFYLRVATYLYLAWCLMWLVLVVSRSTLFLF